ncbi:MAG: sigma 54-interacting transcriptional regulator [Deltaproteobacteria bacterium]|nr:sigma 54-interacting transcriptional regulator [Deltaproteobacteria bacterium]
MTDMKERLLQALEPWSPPLSSILDASHNGIIVVNREGVIVVFNQAARRIFGDENADYAGRHFSDIRNETWTDLQQILDTGRAQIGRKIVMPEATIIANRTPIVVDGKVLGVVTVFQDISEYEAIISQLKGYQRLHRELEAIIESSYDGLYITDGRADTIYVNSAYERITGLSRHDLLGRNMKDLVKDRVFDHSVTLQVLKSRRHVTLMQKVKGNKQIIVTGTPIFDEEGGISIVVTNVRDITELNELRAQLEESRRLSNLYYESLMEQEEFEHILEEMVVKSTAMMQVIRKAIKVAKVDASVLIDGESGVGKSMLARIIHQMSPRKDKPFMKINCGAIPASLIESELFGYERGAFTGAAHEGKAGLLEVANSGTVFLDEVGTLKPSMQVKLLEVIESKTFIRVGGTVPVSVDIRILAATNSDLKEMMLKGHFREDLYYRLNVIPIHIPPLRQRREDIPVLALNILEKINKTRNLDMRIDPDVLERLMRYDYPGNVRELINIMERMCIMSEGDHIGLVDMPEEVREPKAMIHDLVNEGMSLKEAARVVEIQMIQSAFRRYGSTSRVSKALGVHPTTLWRKMEKYGIREDIAKLQSDCI